MFSGLNPPPPQPQGNVSELRNLLIVTLITLDALFIYMLSLLRYYGTLTLVLILR